MFFDFITRFFCPHVYKPVDKYVMVNTRGTPIYDVYISRCEKCGRYKRFDTLC